MFNRALSAFTALSALIGLTSSSSPAEAQSLQDCGQIHIEAEAECEVTGGVTCEAMCTPVNVRAACAGKLTAECDAKCTDLPSVKCQGSCEADCMATCDADPGKFDCQGSCELDCSGSCSAKCQGSNNRAQCEASCEGSCAASCQGKCEVEPPSANCEAKCSASCEGSCTADANFDCQVDCQSELYAECEVDIEGGCKADCDTEEGALFCDGQYVDHGDHLDMCISAIQAYIDANVEGYAEGSSSCANGKCEAQGEAGVSCAVSPASRSSGMAGFLFATSAAALAVSRRRKRR